MAVTTEAPTTAGHGTQRRKMTAWGREAAHLAILVLGLLALRDVVANQYKVPSGSMEPTLQVGDRVLVDMREYGWRVPFTMWRITDGSAPAPGDVVVFPDPQDGVRLIKRVVAVEGDTVSVRDGQVIVDGSAMARAESPGLEWYRGRSVHVNLAGQEGTEVTVGRIPEGQVLVLGDNRGNSLDGRHFGLVDQRTIYGRAVRVIYRKDNGLQWIGL